MKDIFNEIHELNQIDKCGISKAVCKMAEEFGELAQAVNMTIGRKKHNLTEEQINENIAEESADLIQNVFCVADKRGISYEDIAKKLSDKNRKWRKNVLENKHTNKFDAPVAEALKNLMASIGGGQKKCGHNYSCICAWDEAKKALDLFIKQE